MDLLSLIGSAVDFVGRLIFYIYVLALALMISVGWTVHITILILRAQLTAERILVTASLLLFLAIYLRFFYTPGLRQRLRARFLEQAEGHPPPLLARARAAWDAAWEAGALATAHTVALALHGEVRRTAAAVVDAAALVLSGVVWALWLRCMLDGAGGRPPEDAKLVLPAGVELKPGEGGRVLITRSGAGWVAKAGEWGSPGCDCVWSDEPFRNATLRDRRTRWVHTVDGEQVPIMIEVKDLDLEPASRFVGVAEQLGWYEKAKRELVII
ncbi:hypothetical protein F5B20DRAFT_588202 [Whalleya microplaca]|nr:hypothetical protein F5B20DRAFT_588202 [Whalleya microplaca]